MRLTRTHFLSTTALLCLAAAGLPSTGYAQITTPDERTSQTVTEGDTAQNRDGSDGTNMMVDGEWEHDLPDSAPPEPDLLDKGNKDDVNPAGRAFYEESGDRSDDGNIDLNEYDEFEDADEKVNGDMDGNTQIHDADRSEQTFDRNRSSQVRDADRPGQTVESGENSADNEGNADSQDGSHTQSGTAR